MLDKAKWICHPEDGRESRLVPVFRRCFSVRSSLKRAVLRLTAHGIYSAEMNGKAVSEDRFAPGLTSYYYRIQVQEYDVTAFLHAGENEWRTTVADGWWRWNNNFGTRLAMIGELQLDYTDGSQECFVTDETWEVATGPCISADLKKGEVYDARIEPKHWQKAMEETFHIDAPLILQEGVPVREHENLSGKAMRDSAGNLVFDFGQNMAGYVRMALRHTQPGQRIHLKHGEALDLEGKFSTANVDMGENPFQEITYICKGAEMEVYQPRFAVFGFRYVLVEGIEDIDMTAIAVYSDMEETGSFECSHPLINQLGKNALWSQKGNFLDVATDCPTRERNAWTGDGQIYCRTAAYFMDVRRFFKKWLKDQTIEQYENGMVGITFPSTSSVHDPAELPYVKAKNPMVELAGPTGNGFAGEESAGWGDAAVWIPWQMYQMYGDREFLENQYDTARRWVDYALSSMKEKNPYYADKPWYANGDGDYIYDSKFHYGEWCEPFPMDPEVVQLFKDGGTGADYVMLKRKYGQPEVATAYTKRSCDVLSAMAKVLGKEEDAQKYSAVAQKIKAAYDQYLIDDAGVIKPGHQAPYVRALALDMVSEKKKPLVIDQLKKELAAANDHLNTGFLSTVYLLPTLCDYGMKEEAFKILEQTDTPGWLHPVTLGATTIPETWDGFDRFKDSLNHYSFGAVCQFLFEYVGGIRPLKPGFSEFALHPVMGGSLQWAKAAYKTKYGCIASEWKMQDGTFTYHCVIPQETTAHLLLPNGETRILIGGDYTFEGEIQ